MTTDTQFKAWNDLLASGSIKTQHKKILAAYDVFGPMADFRLIKFVPTKRQNDLATRRYELCKKYDLVGLIPGVKDISPDGKEQMVWGLRAKHGAEKYLQPDSVRMKVNGENAYLEYDRGRLAEFTDAEKIEHWNWLFNKATTPKPKKKKRGT
jgi:hypothetical protein